MGHRSNLLIIEKSDFTLYYDHWSGSQMDFELFWGPEFAREFIEEREPKPDSWGAPVWTEGACILDFDKKHLLWFGGQDVASDVKLNMIHSELLKHQWPNWTIEWAKNGLYEIAEYVGVTLEPWITPTDRDLDSLTLPLENEFSAGTDVKAEGLFSITRNAVTRASMLNAESLECLCAPNLNVQKIETLISKSRLEPFGYNKRHNDYLSSCLMGVHFNCDSRSMKIWHMDRLEGILPEIQRQWPSWAIVCTGPDFGWHEKVLPGPWWPKPKKEEKIALLEHYRRLLNVSRENPILGLSAVFAGKDVQLNSATLEHRYGSISGLLKKNEIIDNLINQLQANS